MGTDGCGGCVYTDAGEADRQAVFDADRRCIFDIGKRDSSNGRVERGIVKVGEEVEIVGLRATRKTVATGVEMFRKLLDEGQAGDNVGVLLRGIEKRRGRERAGISEAREHNAAHEISRQRYIY